MLTILMLSLAVFVNIGIAVLLVDRARAVRRRGWRALCLFNSDSVRWR